MQSICKFIRFSMMLTHWIHLKGVRTGTTAVKITNGMMIAAAGGDKLNTWQEAAKAAELSLVQLTQLIIQITSQWVV